MTDPLEKQLLRAHADANLSALVTLYTKAADQAEARGDTQACCFYLTHAFVFALEHGDARADRVNARLAAYGRDPRLDF